MNDTIGYIAAFLTTASFLPQAILTLRTRKTDEISFWMYLLFSIGVACWLIYGWGLGDAAIILANAMTLLLALPILTIKICNLGSEARARRNSVAAHPASERFQRNPD